MAKRIVDEEMRFTVIINGNNAQKELYDLEKSTRKLTQENKDLRAERAKLQAQGKRDSQEYKNLTAKIKENSLTLEANRKRMAALQKEIGVTGLTMGQLSKKAAALRIQLRNMVPGSALYKKLEADLQSVNTRLTQLRNGARATDSSLSKLANGFNKYQALGLGIIASLTGIVLSMQRLIDFNAKLSDAQSDVQKTTGLTKKEVDELTKSFGLFKTRTARIELLELATEAGRLGIEGTENIKAFTEQANKMKVALGDDLSTEQIREVGKIVNIYGVGTEVGKDFAGSMDAVGSAINEVSASGANNAGFLVEYLKRQAGIAKQAKLSAADNIGYAATFDEIGQSVEVSATAMNKVFLDMFDNPKEYAKVAGLSLKEFNNLLVTDSNAAMIQFLEGLNGNNDGLQVMIRRLDELDVGGTRGIQALSALAGNTQLLKERQELANSALEEATSLTDEYNLKNNNLAATIEKVRKQIIGAFTSEVVIDGLSSLVEWVAKFIGASEDADGSVTRFRNRLVAFLKVVLVLTTAVLSYNTSVRLTALFTDQAYKATKLYQLILKLSTITTNTLRGAQLLLSAAYFRVTGNVTKATAAMRLFNTTSAISPWGALLAVISAIVVAYALFSENAKKAATAQDFLNDASKDAQKNIAGEAANLRVLLAIAKSETASKEAKAKAVADLNRLVPEYNNQLTEEIALTQEADAILNKHIETLELQAKTEFLRQLVKKKAEAVIEAENSSLKDNLKWYTALWNGIKTGGALYAGMIKNNESAIESKEKLVEATKAELEIAKKLLTERLKANPEEIGRLAGLNSTTAPNPLPPRPTKDKVDRKKQLEEANKDLLDAEREAQDARIELIDDAYLKELSHLKVAHERKLEDLRAQKIKEEEIEKLQGSIDSALIQGKAKEAIALENIKTAWLKKNAAINKQIEYENQLSGFRQAELVNVGYEAQLKDLEDKFAREKIIRETNFLNQMNALGENAKAKKALQEEFNKSELEAEEAHLKELIRQMQLVVDDGDFGGFDLELLSPEQKDNMLKLLEELRLKLEELGIERKKISNPETKDSLGDGTKTDILGFTIDDWKELYDNLKEGKDKLKGITMAVYALQNAWGTYNEYLNASEQKRFRDFEKKNNNQKILLKQRLDSGLINQRQYDKAVEGLEKEAEKRKAELEYKAAKRKYQLDLTQAIASTAMAVINGLQTTPFFPLGIAMGALAGILGGIQIATIAKNKPVKGYQDGYYGNFPVRREQDGRVFDAQFGGDSSSGIVRKPTVFLAGEQGQNFPELIVSGPDLKRFNPAVTQSISNELSRIRGFENGYTGPSVRNAETPADTSNNDLLIDTINANTALLIKIREEGVQAWLAKDMKNFKEIKEGVQRLDTYRNKSRP